MGEFEKGLADLNEAVRLAETFGSRECQAYSLSGRALAHAGLDAFDKASGDFQRSVDIRPENAWVYYNQGLAYDRMGNPREASVCFNLALALDEPPLPPRKRQRAKAYVRRQSESEPG
jgi:tetratricopeptide (TPR) repeat protein